MRRRISSYVASCALLLTVFLAFLGGCSSSLKSPSNPIPQGPGSGGGGTGGNGNGGGGGTGGGGTGGGGGSGTGGGGSGSGGGGSSTGASEFVYMTANQQEGLVYEFQVDTSTGVFTQMAGSPFKADIGNPTFVCTNFCGSSLIPDPLGRFLYYQYNYGSSSMNGVDSLSVNAQNGTLSNNSKILQPAYELSADPQGRFLYWNGSNGQTNAVGAFAISSAGELTTAPGQPYIYPGQTSYGAPAVTGNYVFAIEYLDPRSNSGQGYLLEWTIDPATGTLTRTSNNLPLRLGGDPVVTPNGKFLYVQQAYLSNNVYYWEVVPIRVGADGSLTELSQYIQQTPSTGDSDIWMSPNGNFLYVSIYGQIWDYQIDQTTGALTLVQKYTDINTNLLAIDPAVKYVFLSPEGKNQAATTMLTAYSVNPATGALTAVPNSTVDTHVTPIGLAVMSPH